MLYTRGDLVYRSLALTRSQVTFNVEIVAETFVYKFAPATAYYLFDCNAMIEAIVPRVTCVYTYSRVCCVIGASCIVSL